MPRIFENEDEQDNIKRTFAHNSLIINQKGPGHHPNFIDFSRERAELEEIERQYLERIAPRGFQNGYIRRVDELRVL
jgi:hypothetical protein